MSIGPPEREWLPGLGFIWDGLSSQFYSIAGKSFEFSVVAVMYEGSFRLVLSSIKVLFLLCYRLKGSRQLK